MVPYHDSNLVLRLLLYGIGFGGLGFRADELNFCTRALESLQRFAACYRVEHKPFTRLQYRGGRDNYDETLFQRSRRVF